MTIWTAQMGDHSNPLLVGHNSTCAILGLQGICHGIRQDKGQPGGKIVTNPGRRTKTKRLSMHEKLAMEIHECKLMYLTEEHDMKT
ncbi:unnamed protein product [Coregonus sp. 'balchen']|nr:unnamed protein product [Coregonus sp. 'balchen']